MDLAYDGFHDFIEFRVRGNLKKDKEKMIKKIADEIYQAGEKGRSNLLIFRNRGRRSR